MYVKPKHIQNVAVFESFYVSLFTVIFFLKYTQNKERQENKNYTKEKPININTRQETINLKLCLILYYFFKIYYKCILKSQDNNFSKNISEIRG